MSANVQSTPMVRGLRTWPAQPPTFDALDLPGPFLIPIGFDHAKPPPDAESVPSGLVTRGQRIASGTELGGAAILSPAAGQLGPTRVVELFDGRSVRAIELTATPAAPTPSESAAQEAARDLSSGDISFWLDRLTSCGVWADRTYSPDLNGQLHAALRRPIDTVICHALDTDPAACVLSAWAAAHVEELVTGVTLLARLYNATTRYIVLDERVPSGWWTTLRPAARSASVKVMLLENDYPLANPTLLLYSLLGRRLRPGRLPVEQGVLMLDAAAAIAVGAAALRAEPMLHVPLAVRDHARSNSCFITAPIGASAAQILSMLIPTVPGSGPRAPMLLRGGDMLRDLRLSPGAIVSGSELILHASVLPPEVNPDACIRCGWCYESCPTRVQPADVLEAAQRGDHGMAELAGIEACIECGVCTYVCPSKLPLLAGIRAVRKAQATI